MKDGKFVIQCVDDDPDILKTLQTILEANNYVVVTSPSAADALVRYQANRPDLMIVNLMMEQVDSGVNLVRQIIALGNQPPLYMLSSLGDQLHLTVDTSTLGFAGVFQKPIEPRTLLATLRTQLTR